MGSVRILKDKTDAAQSLAMNSHDLQVVVYELVNY
jgi:hypothetical protein